MGSLVLSKFKILLMFCVIFHGSVAGPSVFVRAGGERTTESKTTREKESVNNQTEKPRQGVLLLLSPLSGLSLLPLRSAATLLDSKDSSRDAAREMLECTGCLLNPSLLQMTSKDIEGSDGTWTSLYAAPCKETESGHFTLELESSVPSVTYQRDELLTDRYVQLLTTSSLVVSGTELWSYKVQQSENRDDNWRSVMNIFTPTIDPTAVVNTGTPEFEDIQHRIQSPSTTLSNTQSISGSRVQDKNAVIDTELIHEISDPQKTNPGDYLFEVSIGVKFVGGNFKKFEGIERRVARSIKNLVTEKLSSFTPSLKKLLLRDVKRLNAPSLLFIYWLYFNPSGEDIYIPVQSRINQLLNKPVANLRYGKAVLFSISVEDVDECSSGLSMCDPEANCFNAFGFYSCQCMKGFEDHSSTGSGTNCVQNVKSESGFGSSLGLQEILAGIILCVVLILAVILMLLFTVSKRRNKRIFDACNQSSDGSFPRHQPSLPQEEMRRERSLVFTSCETKNNTVTFTKFKPLEDTVGQQLHCTEFSKVQKQLSVETPSL